MQSVARVCEARGPWGRSTETRDTAMMWQVAWMSPPTPSPTSACQQQPPACCHSPKPGDCHLYLQSLLHRTQGMGALDGSHLPMGVWGVILNLHVPRGVHVLAQRWPAGGPASHSCNPFTKPPFHVHFHLPCSFSLSLLLPGGTFQIQLPVPQRWPPGLLLGNPF